MSYRLNEDQRRIQELIRRVAAERVAPRAMEIDAKVLQIVEGTNQIQRNIIARNLLGPVRKIG